MAITILDVFEARRKAKGISAFKSHTAAEFEAEGLAMFGGCSGCTESLAAYNGYPSQSGYWRCKGCLGDDGFQTVEEFDDWYAEVATANASPADVSQAATIGPVETVYDRSDGRKLSWTVYVVQRRERDTWITIGTVESFDKTTPIVEQLEHGAIYRPASPLLIGAMAPRGDVGGDADFGSEFGDDDWGFDEDDVRIMQVDSHELETNLPGAPDSD
jgi:hypothetical protein